MPEQEKDEAPTSLAELSSAYCPNCSEPELEFGFCRYCGWDVWKGEARDA